MQQLLSPAAASQPLARRATALCSCRAPLLQPARCQQRATVRLVAVRAQEGESSSSTSAAAAGAADEPVAAEQLLKRRKGGKDKAGAAAGSKQAGPKVIAPVRDQVYGGGPLTPEQKAENSVVALLATLFFVILAEGVFLAGSGFMSEGMDQFAQDVVFPAFTPTLGLFLAISTAYGLWKTRAAPEEKQ